MIEKDFDIPFIADLALREKQIQQNYRPIIAVHKWFARRPGTLFRGLLLAEFCTGPLRESFYQANICRDLWIADPFMGGGTPLMEANRLGCDVIGFDINPMAYWIVSRKSSIWTWTLIRGRRIPARSTGKRKSGIFIKPAAVSAETRRHRSNTFLGQNHCVPRLRSTVDLFPGYLMLPTRRHPNNVFALSALRAA